MDEETLLVGSKDMQFAFRIPCFPVLLDTGDALIGARTPTELEKKAARLSVSEQPKLYIIDSTAEDFALDLSTMLVRPRVALRRRTKSELIALYNLRRDPGRPKYTTASLSSKRVERVVADLVELLCRPALDQA
jgi:hypothetical protein